MSDAPPTPEMLAATAELRELLTPVLRALGFPKPHTCPTGIAVLPWQPCGYRDWDHTVFAYINTNDSDLNLSVTAEDVPRARYELLRKITAQIEERTRRAAERRDDAVRDYAIWDSAGSILTAASSPQVAPPPPDDPTATQGEPSPVKPWNPGEPTPAMKAAADTLRELLTPALVALGHTRRLGRWSWTDPRYASRTNPRARVWRVKLHPYEPFPETTPTEGARP